MIGYERASRDAVVSARRDWVVPSWEREFRISAPDERAAHVEAVRLAVSTYDLEHDEVTILAATPLRIAAGSIRWLVRVRVA